MIRNVVFDMGNVLLRFDPELFMERAGVAPEDRPLMMREVYRSLEWARMDRGSLSEKEAAELFRARLPEHLRGAVGDLVAFYDRPILGFEGMCELLAQLKEKGLGLYLLSNAAPSQHEYWPRLPESRFFDGTLISCDVGLVKPQPEIYRLLCGRFALKPEECLFVDDLPLNVEGACCCGMDGVVFHGDVSLLRKELAQRGVL